MSTGRTLGQLSFFFFYKIWQYWPKKEVVLFNKMEKTHLVLWPEMNVILLCLRHTNTHPLKEDVFRKSSSIGGWSNLPCRIWNCMQVPTTSTFKGQRRCFGRKPFSFFHTIFSKNVIELTNVRQNRWTRVCPSLRGDCHQTRWFLCWPDKIHWTSWFLWI